MSQLAPVPFGNLYYRHSGRYSPGGVIKALVLGGLLGLALGVVYAYVDLYNPIAGWVTFIVTGGTGLLMGVGLSKLIKSGKVRNGKLAMFIGLLCVGWMLLVTWEVWLFAVLQRGHANVTLAELVLHPVAAWNVLLLINQNGAWSLKGDTPTGIILWVLWAIEAAILIWIPMGMVKSAVNALPFCEKCDTWGGTRALMNLSPGDKQRVKSRLESKDFSVLGELGKASSLAKNFWTAYFQGCGNCDTTQTLCVDEVTVTTDKEGKASVKTSPLVKRLMLTPEDTVAVATAVAMMNMPPVEEAPPAETVPVAEAPSTVQPVETPPPVEGA